MPPPQSMSLVAAVLLLSGCIVVPRTTIAYDEQCQIVRKQMSLKAEQVGLLADCSNDACVGVLVGAGVVTAVTAVVSGSVVVIGNVVYWLEKQGNCRSRPQ